MSSEKKPPLPPPPCYPYLVPVTNLEKYNVVIEGPLGTCPSGQTNYAQIPLPQPGIKFGTVFSVGCMTPAQA